MEQIVARQAVRIIELEDDLKDRDSRLDQIHRLLICMGGPLNDNVLKFNKEQRLYLKRILDLAEA